MNAHVQQDLLPPLTPEKFGLTQERVHYFEERCKPKHWTFLVPIALNFLIALYVFDYGFPRVHPPILIFLSIALFPGFVVGGVIEGRRTSKVKTSADFNNYLNYQEALKAHRDLWRKLRWEQIRTQREKEKKAKQAEEWWRGMDGKGFELEVANVLLSKRSHLLCGF